MLTRRSFLSASATLALGQLLLGCNPNAQQSPRVRILRGSVPAQILQAFQRQGKDWKFAQSSQLDELFKLLETWKTQQNSQPSSGFRLPFTQAPSAPIDDLITLGDFWLAAAIQQNLIQPLPLADLAEWQQIPPQWQALVKRDRQGFPSPEGEIWAAPYRWGTLMIAYRPDKFSELGWVPQQWSDLWRPELKGHLSLPDSPREVIGLTLKKLGQSANAPDLLAIGVLTEELNRLHQQVKFYSSTHYLQPLLLEDTWAAVGWSPEILATLDREPELTAAIPTEGTLLTADLWVRPNASSAAATTANSAQTPASDSFQQIQQWIQFCWQPAIANQLSLLSDATSPIFVGSGRAQASPLLQSKPLLLPPEAALQNSEFLQPLPPAAIDQYRRQWLQTRQATLLQSLELPPAQMGQGTRHS